MRCRLRFNDTEYGMAGIETVTVLRSLLVWSEVRYGLDAVPCRSVLLQEKMPLFSRPVFRAILCGMEMSCGAGCREVTGSGEFPPSSKSIDFRKTIGIESLKHDGAEPAKLAHA